MKKKYKIYDVKNFDLKLFTSLLSGAIILTGFKIYKNENHSQKDNNLITIYSEFDKEKTKNQNLPNQESYTYTELEPQSDEYYRSIEVDGKVINFVKNPEVNYDLIDAYTDDMIIGEDGIYPEGYFEYLDIKEHSLNFKTTDEMISFYSKVFELDEEICHKIIRPDDNYSEDEISMILCDLSKHPEDYGYSEEEIRSQDGYQLDYYYIEELLYKFCKVKGVNPDIALAIAYSECGYNLGSYLCVYYHNLGGIVSNNGFAKYRNEATGIYEYVSLLRYRYYVDEESDSNKLKSMASGYCENPDHWYYDLVGPTFSYIRENGYGSIFYKYRNPSRDLIYCDEEVKSFYLSKYYNS